MKGLRLIRTLVLAGFLGVPLAAVAQSEAQTETPVVTARFALTNFRMTLDEQRPYAITQSGDVTLRGRKVSADTLEADLATMSPFKNPALAITIDPRAALPDIVSRLALFAEKRDLMLVGVETYRTFIEPSNRADVERPGPACRGATGQFELPVVVGLAPDGQTCEATISGRSMVDDALYQEAFAVLDRLVTEHGGPENTLAKTGAGREIVARVQSGAETPWRCVAGVILALQRSGWPNVQLEVEPR
jgi:biopolymer transport protein ExbD